ncbi:hemolysin family protein [Leptotrichia sp. oral taxon 212]|uniref:hemolysin family protein n=1 Tax=Leptotrichia sp. oral taxon 212 TaxID=712357 RepID=UPI0009FB1B02
MTGGSLLLEFIVIMALTGINAFFSSAEMAIVSINKNKLKILVEEGNKKAIMLENLMKEPSKFLSTIQVGITLAGFFASASAATGLSQYLSIYLRKLGIPYSGQISMILITFVLSYITLVFGELIPKRIALKSSEKIALSSVGTIVTVSKIFSPFVKFLTFSTNIVLTALKMKEDNIEEKVSKEELRSLVEVGREHGIINEVEKEMIENIIEFDEKVAREIMIPRTKVFLVDKNISVDELFEKKEVEVYSRIPVYEDEADNIVGILFMKDLMIEAYRKGFQNVKLPEIMQEAYFVPETKNVNELFNEMQSEKKHIAILIDEYGGFSGIVTLEDLIEEVMGNISDEFDADDSSIKKLSANKYLVNGELSLNDLNDYFHIELESKHYDTLSGLLIEHMGYIPEDDEDIEPIIIDEISFKPKRVKDKKIEWVLAKFNKEEKLN